jgi:hypothetical protein
MTPRYISELLNCPSRLYFCIHVVCKMASNCDDLYKLAQETITPFNARLLHCRNLRVRVIAFAHRRPYGARVVVSARDIVSNELKGQFLVRVSTTTDIGFVQKFLLSQERLYCSLDISDICDSSSDDDVVTLSQTSQQ